MTAGPPSHPGGGYAASPRGRKPPILPGARREGWQVPPWLHDLAGVGCARALVRPPALAIDAVFGRGQARQKVNAFDAASAYCELLAADRTVELRMGDRDR